MLRLRVLFALVVLCLPSQASGQTWSEQEEQLFAHIEACWEGYGRLAFDEHARRCGTHASMIYWWSEESEPRDVEWIRRNVEMNWDELEVVAQEFVPRRVAQHGNFFLVFYTGRRTIRTGDGEQRSVEWKGTEVWRRTGEGWEYLGGMGAPDAAA